MSSGTQPCPARAATPARAQATSPAAAIERVGPLHAQGVESTYVNLWSRIAGFRREQLTRALERGAVVRGGLLRNTLHLVSAREHPVYVAALRQSRLRWMAHAWKQHFDERTMKRAERTLEKLAAEPRPFGELVEAVGGDTWLVRAVAIHRGLLTVPPAGTWGFHGTSPYRLSAEEPADPAKSMRHIVRHYFAAFGPATVDDLCFWAGSASATSSPSSTTSTSAASGTSTVGCCSTSRARRSPTRTRLPGRAFCCAGTTSTSGTRRERATASCRRPPQARLHREHGHASHVPRRRLRRRNLAPGARSRRRRAVAAADESRKDIPEERVGRPCRLPLRLG